MVDPTLVRDMVGSEPASYPLKHVLHMPEQEGLKQESGMGMEEPVCSWKAIQRPWQFLICCLCSVTGSQKDFVSSSRAVSQIPTAFL